MTLFSSSAQGVPFVGEASSKATEARTVFKNEDRPVFRSEAKQAGAFLDYVRALENPALPAMAVGQGLPTVLVMQPSQTMDVPRPANDRLAAIPKSRLGPDAAETLDNDYGNVKDPRGSFHRFGKVGLMWGAGPDGRGMPQPIGAAQDIGKVVDLENKNRLGEVTRLTYRAGQKAASDAGRELKNTFQGIGENAAATSNLDLPKNADAGEKSKTEAGQKAAAAAQQAKIDAIAKQREAPISAYTSGFSAAW